MQLLKNFIKFRKNGNALFLTYTLLRHEFSDGYMVMPYNVTTDGWLNCVSIFDANCCRDRESLILKVTVFPSRIYQKLETQKLLL